MAPTSWPARRYVAGSSSPSGTPSRSCCPGRFSCRSRSPRALRGVEPERQPGTRLAIVWAAVMFHRRRALASPAMALLSPALRPGWRCSSRPGSVTCDGPGVRRPLPWRGSWVAVGLTVGPNHADDTSQSGDRTGKPLPRKPDGSLGRSSRSTPPELVFQFYLRRPVLVTPDYQTFAQTTEARYLLAPRSERVALTGVGPPASPCRRADSRSAASFSSSGE